MPTDAIRSPRAILVWAALLTVYVVWGSTYFGIAIAIESIPPFLMGVIRFTIAGSLLIAWDLLRNPAARRWPSRREMRDSLIVGGLLLGVGNGFVSWGEMTVPSGIAAILVAMIPVWFAVLGWLYFRDRLPRIVGLAIIIGFAGVSLLVWPAGEGANHFDLGGILILIIAPIGWAHGSLFAARKAVLPRSALTASGLQMLAGAVVGLACATLAGEPARFIPGAITAESAIAVGYLVVFGSMVAFTAYGWLLRHAPLSLIGTYAYVNPIVAVALGTLFLAEPISPRTVVASAVVLVAVAMIVSARGRMRAPEVAGASAEGEPEAELVHARGPEPRPRLSAVAPPPAPSGKPAAPSP